MNVKVSHRSPIPFGSDPLNRQLLAQPAGIVVAEISPHTPNQIHTHGVLQRGVQPHPIDANSRFPIASVTKPITARVVDHIRRKHDLSWATPVISLWPEFRLADAIATRQMTLADLLIHYSGLPSHTWAWVYAGCDRASFMRQRLPHLTAIAPFRERVRYSNLTVALAGFLAEHLSGVSWEEHVTALAKEMNMPGLTHLDADWAKQPNMALPHRDGQTLPPFHAEAFHPIAPASELAASITDLIAFARDALAHPSPTETPEAPVTAERPHSQLGPLSYLPGWRKETWRGEQHIWHSGSCTGYGALISLWPKQHRAFVALCNEDDSTDLLRTLVYRRFDEYANIPTADRFRWPEPENNTSSATRKPHPQRPAKLPDAGRYRNPGYGELDLDGTPNGQQTVYWNGQQAATLFLEEDGPQLKLDRYNVSWPITLTPKGFTAPLQSGIDPIAFERIS